MRLEGLKPDAVVRSILPDAGVTVVSVEWHGSDALTLVYRGPNGKVADEILYRHDEPRLAAVETGRPWSFDGDGALFRLVPYTSREWFVGNGLRPILTVADRPAVTG